MKKLICVCIMSIILISISNEVLAKDYETIMKQDLLTMMMAYPEHITGVKAKDNGLVYIVTSSGKVILYDDKRSKSNEEKNSNGDIQDMLEVIYPLKPIDKLMEVSMDPGRTRIYGLLNEVYGGSEQKVNSNLIGVNAPYRSYLFNKNNCAANSLKLVMEELKSLSKNNDKIATLINPVNGTFNYRTISGTGRLSPHAYGIAIDLKSNPNDYWKWSKREGGEKRMLWYPKELVDVFEKNNFIWGGKWGHFDILHFEYRPEIIIKARYFSKDQESEEKWFEGVPMDIKVEQYIRIIEDAFK